MKKLISICMALLLMVGIAACGASPAAPTPAPTPAPTEAPAATEAPAPAEAEAPAETEAPAPEETEAPAPEETEAPAEPAEDSVVGGYRLTSIEAEGDEDEEDSMAFLEALGIKYYLFVNEDGSALMEILDEQTRLTWDEEKFYSVEEVEEGEDASIPYTYADGVLTMIAEEEGSMVFTKLTAEELAEYEENGPGNIEDIFGGWDIGEGGETEIPEGEPSEGPVSGTVDGNPVTILGAEALEQDGRNLIRFYYDFTNGSDEPVTSYFSLYFNGAQDGAALEQVWYPENSVPEDSYEDVRILPGKTIRCTVLYYFDPEGGTTALQISDIDDEDILLYYVDPQNLSGAPEEPFALESDPDSAAALVADLSAEGEDTAVLRTEIVTDDEGNNCLRAYFSFTNNGDEEISLYTGHTPSAYQDGYSLETVSPSSSVPEDENLWTDIAPGETIECAQCYALRSDSPVAVLLTEDWTGDSIGFLAELD